MSVLIRGAEMPQKCNDCFVWNCLFDNGGYEPRPEHCPLVPVPPHGRMIDADARVNVQMYNDEFEDYQTVNMSIDDLLDSSWIELEDDPTIIQAEPKKEGGA